MAKQVVVFKLKIQDTPGVLANMLEQGSNFGLDLEAACAAGCEGGEAVLFAVPKDETIGRQVASAGGQPVEECAGFLLEGDDRVGAGAAALKPLGNINLLACAALVSGGRYQTLVVVENKDAAAAAKALGV